MNARAKLEKAAVSLAAGPAFHEWKEFMAALAEYHGEQKDALVSAPAERVFITQGHAQGLGVLVTLLAQARAPAQK